MRARAADSVEKGPNSSHSAEAGVNETLVVGCDTGFPAREFADSQLAVGVL